VSYTFPLYVLYFLKPLTWLVSGGVLFWTSLCPIFPFTLKKNGFCILIKVSISTHKLCNFTRAYTIMHFTTRLPVVHACVYLARLKKKKALDLYSNPSIHFKPNLRGSWLSFIPTRISSFQYISDQLLTSWGVFCFPLY
jgi:hypothetical protein